MEHENFPAFVFDTHEMAEDAIRAIGKSGFDVKKLSLISKGFHSDEHPVGFYTAGDKIKLWGGRGAFWGSIWGLLLAPAVFFLPGLGLMAMAGPIVSLLVGAIEGAAIGGGLSALGAALIQIGMPKEQAIKYETALKADKYVLVVHGGSEDTAIVRAALSESKLLEAA